MKILAIIPARGGSKGIPHKNIKPLGSKELICYTIETAIACNLLDTVMVSTDDEKIAKVSEKTGAKIPFLRPTHLAKDTSPTIDTIIHTLRFYKEKGQKFDAVCLLQPTVPFRHPNLIKEAVNKFKEQKADSLITVREVPHVYNPHWVYEQKEDSSFLKLAMQDENIIPRRQSLPKAFHRDGSIYLTKTKVILEENSLYGKKVAFLVNENSPDINIDTMSDWEKAEKELLK